MWLPVQHLERQCTLQYSSESTYAAFYSGEGSPKVGDLSSLPRHREADDYRAQALRKAAQLLYIIHMPLSAGGRQIFAALTVSIAHDRPAAHLIELAEHAVQSFGGCLLVQRACTVIEQIEIQTHASNFCLGVLHCRPYKPKFERASFYVILYKCDPECHIFEGLRGSSIGFFNIQPGDGI